MPGKIKRTVVTETSAVGFVETPTVVVSGVPAEAEVGDAITPAVNVKRADTTTPVANVMVDFFVTDSAGTMSLGDRQLTDSSGDATAGEVYYVSPADADTDLSFRIVLRAHNL